MNSGPQELVCKAKNDILKANNSEDVRWAIAPLALNAKERSRKIRRQSTKENYLRAALVDNVHSLARAQRQVLHGALNELATDNATERLAKLLARTNRPQPQIEARSQLESDKYTAYSPTLRRLLSSLDICYGGALEQILADSQRGVMPAAAICEVAEELYPDWKGCIGLWKRYSNSKLARFQRENNIQPIPTFEGHVKRSIDNNILMNAALLIGRGLAHDSLAPPPDKSKTDFAASQLPQMAALSTVIGNVSGPIMRPFQGLLTAYSHWENGAIDAAAFRNEQNPFNTPNAVYHSSLANGRWDDKFGYCAATLPYSEERAPAVLAGIPFDRLDVPHSALTPCTPAHTFLGSIILLSDQTIYANWPE